MREDTGSTRILGKAISDALVYKLEEEIPSKCYYNLSDFELHAVTVDSDLEVFKLLS